MKLYPTGGNVVIEPVEAVMQTEGGIHLPENRQKGAIIEGKVLAIGPMVSLVEVGQTVIFDKHSPTMREIKEGNTAVEEGRRLLIMKECDLKAVYIEEQHV